MAAFKGAILIDAAFRYCVHCIVLKDAGPDIDPHPELRNPRPGAMGISYDCDACGTQWTYHMTRKQE